MKRLALTLGLALCLLSPLNLSAHAQGASAPDESSAVRATVRDYINAYYAGDARRMEQTLHPHYLKHVIAGSLPMTEKTAAQVLQDLHIEGPAAVPDTDQTADITILDVSGDIASAKLVTPRWIDYLTLFKSDGQWKVLSDVQHMDN